MAGGMGNFVNAMSADKAQSTSAPATPTYTPITYTPGKVEYAPITLPTYTPDRTTYFNPYIALNQAYQGGTNPLANPYAIMGGASAPTTPTTAPVANDRAAQLDALSKQYLTQSDTAIAKQKADMIAQAQAAEEAYQRELAAKKYNDMVSKLNQGYVWQNGKLIKPESEYGWMNGVFNNIGGASGGLASLQGFDK